MARAPSRLAVVPATAPHSGAAPATHSGCFSLSSCVMRPPMEAPQTYVRRGGAILSRKKANRSSPARTPSCTAQPLLAYDEPASA